MLSSTAKATSQDRGGATNAQVRASVGGGGGRRQGGGGRRQGEGAPARGWWRQGGGQRGVGSPLDAEVPRGVDVVEEVLCPGVRGRRPFWYSSPCPRMCIRRFASRLNPLPHISQKCVCSRQDLHGVHLHYVHPPHCTHPPPPPQKDTHRESRKHKKECERPALDLDYLHRTRSREQ